MRKRSDRAWWRWRTVHGERRLQVVLVERGVTTTETLEREATERQADRKVAILQAALDRGDIQAPLNWDELVEAFLEDRRERRCRPATLAAYRHHLKSVERTLGEGVDPLTLTERDAERYEREMLDGGASAATVVRGLDAMAIVQRWCIDRGWLRVATWQGVQRPEILTERRHLQPDQAGPFLRAAARLSAAPPGEARRKDWERWEAAAWLLLHGLRVAEAAQLRVGDLDLVSGVVHVYDRIGGRTKSSAGARAVPIVSDGALVCLRRTFRDVAGDEYAFRVQRVGSESARGRTKWFGRRCAATCEAAGIDPPVTPHGLRHTVATAAVVAGADMHSLQALLGHSDARVTAKVYAHASSEQRARGAAGVVGAWLDRVVAARPVMEVVR